MQVTVHAGVNARVTVNELIQLMQEAVERDEEVGDYPVVWQNFPYEIDALEVKFDLMVLQ